MFVKSLHINAKMPKYDFMPVGSEKNLAHKFAFSSSNPIIHPIHQLSICLFNDILSILQILNWNSQNRQGNLICYIFRKKENKILYFTNARKRVIIFCICHFSFPSSLLWFRVLWICCYEKWWPEILLFILKLFL